MYSVSIGTLENEIAVSLKAWTYHASFPYLNFDFIWVAPEWFHGVNVITTYVAEWDIESRSTLYYFLYVS